MSQQPPPPYGAPPPGPWGAPPPARPPGGLPVWGQVLAGGGIGLVVGPVVLLLVLGVLVGALADSPDSDISGATVFTLCVLLPTLLPVPMLFFRPTRMWAVGLIIGAGLSTITLAGVCALVITGLSETSP